MTSTTPPLAERVAAVLAPTVIPIESVRPYGEGRVLVTVSDRVKGDPNRYEAASTINSRAYSAEGHLARAGFRTTPTGAQIIVADAEPAEVIVEEDALAVANRAYAARREAVTAYLANPTPETAARRSEAIAEEARARVALRRSAPVETRSAGSRLSNAAVLNMLRNGGSWTEQDPRVVGPDRA